MDKLEQKDTKNIDYTEFGDDWVNTILDLRLVMQHIPEKYPHFVFYLWDIAKENDKDVVGAEWTGDNVDGLAYAFYTSFGHDVRLIPIIMAAVAKFIEHEPDKDKQEGYRKGIQKILNFPKEKTNEN